MATVLTTPQIVSGNPSLTNTGEDLTVSVPVTNLGQTTANRVYITDITLGTVPRITPKNFPVYIGNLAFESLGNVGARFDARGLAVGSRQLLTIRGTYDRSPVIAFAISRYITIPVVEPAPVVTLRSHVGVALGPATWSYTVYNDEPGGSTLDIVAFHLDVVAPIGLITAPPGWIAETDNLTYVAWIASDVSTPRVKAGASLSGFSIQSATTRSESTSFSLMSWNSATDTAGPVGIDTVLSPMRP